MSIGNGATAAPAAPLCPPHALSLVFSGAPSQQCCSVWVIQMPTTPLFSASCPRCVSTMQEIETGLYNCLSSPGRTHSPSILHELCAFTEDLVQKKAEEVCLAQFSTGTRPNQTHKTKHRNSHQTLLIFIVFT